MKKLIVVIVMALFAWNAEVAFAQKPGVVLTDDPGWRKIGETVASFKSQDESIAVIGADEFSAIKIKVDDAPLHIERLQIFYESGEMEEIDVKKQIAKGEESEVFRLENPERDIQKVAFTYNTVPNSEGEKADVELYGLKPQDEDRASDAYRDDRDRAEESLEETGDDIERETEEAAREAEREAEQVGWKGLQVRGRRRKSDNVSPIASKEKAAMHGGFPVCLPHRLNDYRCSDFSFNCHSETKMHFPLSST